MAVKASLWKQTERSEVTGLAAAVAWLVDGLMRILHALIDATGLSKGLVAIGRGIKATFGPLLARFPGAILISALLVGMAIVWLHFQVFSLVGRAMEVSPPLPARVAGGMFTGLSDALTSFEAGLDAINAPLIPVTKYLFFPLRYWWVRDIIITLSIVFVLIGAIPFFAIWWERKIAGRIQSRLGPMRVGGWHGWAQSAADGIKLISKEDIVPEGADKPLFLLAPYLTIIPSVLAFVGLPFGTYWIFRDLDVGLVFILAMLGVEVVGVIMAGWASNNKWSVYGAMREACQLVSYEIPMGIALTIPIMTAGTLSLREVGDMQAGGFVDWLAFKNPFLFAAAWAYFICSLASCKRAPFDLPESESELVAGFHTEYSGFRWSLFFFAEYAAMFVVSAIAAILFFGAWYSPFPEITSKAFGTFSWGAGPFWLIAKSLALIYVQLWVRWTLPRIRIDQVLYSCIQVMLPMTLVLFVGNAFWELMVPAGGWLAGGVNFVLTAIGVVMVVVFIAIATYGYINKRRLVGTLAIEHLPAS